MQFDLHAQRAMKQIFHARNQTIDVVALGLGSSDGGRLREDHAFAVRRFKNNIRGQSVGCQLNNAKVERLVNLGLAQRGPAPTVATYPW